MVTVKIFAKDNDMPGNQAMIAWVEAKLDTLVSAGVRFSFKILDDTDLKALTSSGINKLPVMFIDKKPYMGSIEIQNSLQGYLKKRATVDPESDGVDEQFHNWQLSEMTMAKRADDARDVDDPSENMKQRATEATEARAKRHTQENIRNKQRAAAAPAKQNAAQPSERPDNMQMPKSMDRDDILISRMLETT